MNRNEKLQIISDINRFIGQINSESNEQSLIIVEGKRDHEALLYLGCLGNIKTLHNFKNPIDLVDNFRRKYKKLILLLDLDKAGEEMTQKLSNILNQRYIDKKYRTNLKKITQGKVKTIEELRSFYNRLSEE